MRLANHEDRAVLVVDEGVIDVARASDGRLAADVHGLYDNWAAFRAAAPELLAGEVEPLDRSRLGAPAPRPRQVFAIGLNYRTHAEEARMAVPSVPATFTKFPTCLVGPNAEVALPSDSVDWEVELVVVIGLRAEGVAPATAWDHVAGVTVGQDLSERVVQFAAGGQFSLGKSYSGFGPMGPWLVTHDELPDPDDLELGCSIDGEEVQRARTSDMIFDVPALIAELSAVVTLLPGDVVFTGTPAGVGVTRQPPRFLRPGEVVESWIEGIGALQNLMVEKG